MSDPAPAPAAPADPAIIKAAIDAKLSAHFARAKKPRCKVVVPAAELHDAAPEACSKVLELLRAEWASVDFDATKGQLMLDVAPAPGGKA